MALIFLGFVYAFGAACIMNYFIMFVRIRTTEMYMQRQERLLEAHHVKAQQQAATSEKSDTTTTTPTTTTTGAEAVAAAVTQAVTDSAAETQQLLPGEPLRVVFLHPDLGIGGAERLVVDAALGLQRHQSLWPVEVVIVTNHHDPTRAFKETVDGTLRVVVRGSVFPSSIFGRCRALCATLRMGFAAFAACWAFPGTSCFVVDQVASTMPVLRFCAGKTPLLFYSHFPDQLCDPNRNDDGTLKDGIPGHAAYRGFFNNLEARGMGFASSIVCNSKFSRQVTVETFPELAEKIDAERDIFYPPVNMDVHVVSEETVVQSAALTELRETVRASITFVSINRYERKKNLVLAVDAFARLLAMDEFSTPPPTVAQEEGSPAAPPRRRLLLVMAGGCDPRLEENVQYAAELAARAAELQIPSDQIRFMQNISDDEKAILLASMCALVYTPSREHFGIVPVEAMAYGRPVVAIANGGPCESVGDASREDPSTCGGILSAPEPAAFAGAMAHFARVSAYAEKVGAQGRARILQQFSMETFSVKLVRRLLALSAAADASILAEALKEEQQKADKAAGKASPSTAEKVKTE